MTEPKDVENQDIEKRQEILRRVATVLQKESAQASDMELVVATAGVSSHEVQRYFGGFNRRRFREAHLMGGRI